MHDRRLVKFSVRFVELMRAQDNRAQQPRRLRFFYLSSAVAAFAWFFTPIPAAIASLVVDQIPLQQDVLLGARAAESSGYRLLSPCSPGRRCVDAVGRSVVAAISHHHPQFASTLNTYDWRFAVTDQSFVNAFAFPGGRIFVTRGLLNLCDDDELAAVIGHEIGHVLHRHSQKRMVQQKLGSVLLSALILGDGDGEAESFGMEAAGVLLQHAASFSTLTYSRSNEFEADELGWYSCTALQRVGGPCRGGALQTFFRKLDGGAGATQWHSTHPGSADRIATLDALQGKYDRRGHASSRGPVAARSGDRFAHIFAPAALRGNTGGVGSSLASLGAAAAAAVPAEALRPLLLGALWQGAAILESLWTTLVEDQEGGARPDGRGARARSAGARAGGPGGGPGGGGARSSSHSQRDGGKRQSERYPYRPVD